MSINEDIKQEKFVSEYSKAIVNLFYTNSWVGQQYLQVFKPKKLTTPQYNVLRILRGQHPQPATINLIIERMIDKSSNASRIVDKLEEKNLVQRNKCSKDRRAVDVMITTKGLALLEELDGVLEKFERSPVLNDEECKQLNLLLDKLRAHQ